MQGFYRGQQKSPERPRRPRRRSSLNECETPPDEAVDPTPYWTWMKAVPESSISATDISTVTFPFAEAMAVSRYEMSENKMRTWSKRLQDEIAANSLLSDERVGDLETMAAQLTEKANESYLERQTSQNRAYSFERASDALSAAEWTDLYNSLKATTTAETDDTWHKWLNKECWWTYDNRDSLLDPYWKPSFADFSHLSRLATWVSGSHHHQWSAPTLTPTIQKMAARGGFKIDT